MSENFCPILTCDASIRMNLRRTLMITSQPSPLAHGRCVLIMREKTMKRVKYVAYGCHSPLKFRSRFDCCSQRLNLVPCQQSTIDIEFNKDNHDYNTRSKNNIRKSASSRNWGHWSSTNLASNDWNKLDLSIRQSPSLASFKRALRIVNSF